MGPRVSVTISVLKRDSSHIDVIVEFKVYVIDLFLKEVINDVTIFLNWMGQDIQDLKVLLFIIV